MQSLALLLGADTRPIGLIDQGELDSRGAVAYMLKAGAIARKLAVAHLR